MYTLCIHQFYISMFSNTNILHKVHLMYTLNIHQGIGVYLVYTLCIQIVYKTEVHFGKGDVKILQKN